MPNTKNTTTAALQEAAARIASLKARTEALRAYTAELRTLRAAANAITRNARKGA
jgi:hypothetical protein